MGDVLHDGQCSPSSCFSIVCTFWIIIKHFSFKCCIFCCAMYCWCCCCCCCCPGIIRFTQLVKLLEKQDAEVQRLNSELRSIVLPQISPPQEPAVWLQPLFITLCSAGLELWQNDAVRSVGTELTTEYNSRTYPQFRNTCCICAAFTAVVCLKIKLKSTGTNRKSALAVVNGRLNVCCLWVLLPPKEVYDFTWVCSSVCEI